MVGGVTVTLDVDMTLDKIDYLAGDTVTLKGKSAVIFLSARSEVGDGSNAARISRQRQYMKAFIDQAKSTMMGDFTLVGDIYNTVMEKSCTDITASEAVYLATDISKYQIEFRTIAGKTVSGNEDGTDMFYPDTDELYRTVIDIFYVKEG
jgi:anionic cell wall polymer biosynthesis LytR-Cps2A-Psr (LCP) family protein